MSHLCSKHSNGFQLTQRRDPTTFSSSSPSTSPTSRKGSRFQEAWSLYALKGFSRNTIQKNTWTWIFIYSEKTNPNKLKISLTQFPLGWILKMWSVKCPTPSNLGGNVKEGMEGWGETTVLINYSWNTLFAYILQNAWPCQHTARLFTDLGGDLCKQGP